MEPRLQRRVQRYGWDKAADYYEEAWKKQLKPAQDKLLEMANLQPGEKVIETSCGTGLVTFRAAEQVAPNGRIVATDISGTMIELAQDLADHQGIDNIIFQRMDAEQLDLEDNQFDTAICCLGLMYFPFPAEGLKEMYRVLKPGGKAVVAIWGERKNCGWADIFPIVDKYVASEVCPMFFQQGTGNTLQKSMESAGLENIETHRFQKTLHFSNREHVLKAAFDGGPVALAYRKFDNQTKENANQEYLSSIEPFQKNGGYAIPGEFVVASGEKT
jgi:ubiquinone/menaquinone biosynthesis C-methylase UbiE